MESKLPTREELVSEQNGLLPKYMPFECHWHEEGEEGQFLASLFLYLLGNSKEPREIFTKKHNISPHLTIKPTIEDNILFLEHFIFYNIPRASFDKAMQPHIEQEEKVKAIAGLINSKIRVKPSDLDSIRIHDIYGAYIALVTENQQNLKKSQKIEFCHNILDIAKKTSYLPCKWIEYKTKCTELAVERPGVNGKSELSDIISDYLDERSRVVDSDGHVKEYYYPFFTSLQKSYTQKRAAVLTLQDALEGKAVDLKQHLDTFNNGNLGKELTAFFKSGRAAGILDKPVSTVSEFITALDELVNKKTGMENK